MTDRIAPRPRVRLAREPRALSSINEARVRYRVVRFLGDLGSGKPRSSAELHAFVGLAAVLRRPELTRILEAAVTRGELVAVDGVAAGNVGGDRTPYRGYALPSADGVVGCQLSVVGAEQSAAAAAAGAARRPDPSDNRELTTDNPPPEGGAA